MRRATVTLAAALALSGATAAAQIAAGEPCDEPLDVGGEVLELVDDVATLTGDVRVVQCEAILSTLKLVATQKPDGGYDTLRAIGEVRYSTGDEAISSRTALYDLDARTITFTDEVVIIQGEQIMTGGELVYWVDTGQVKFTAPEGQRIRGIFHTKTVNAQL